MRSRLFCLVIAWCIASWAAAQTGNPANNPDIASEQEPSLRIESNLVLVPAFVYVHNGVERIPGPEVQPCIDRDWSAFLALNANQPWLPHDCLKKDDFRLFQDGKSQQIESVDRQSWSMTVRDQPGIDQSTFHDETSDTPSGIWSSSDVNGLLLRPTNQHFYMLSYTPDSALPEQGCHRIRVEVDRPGAEVFYRNEYCAGQTPSDLLNGTKFGEKLEHELSEKGVGKIPLYVRAGVFRNRADRKQRADVVVEFPWNMLSRSWDQQRGRLYASIGILGAVYSKDGRLVTRFSDLLWPSWWPYYVQGRQQGNADVFINDSGGTGVGGALLHMILGRQEVAALPTRYETQFDLEPGEYTLRVILSDGVKAGRVEMPLTVEQKNKNTLGLGSVFLCRRYRDANVAAAESAVAKSAPQYVPLVSRGVRVIPAGSTEFGPLDNMAAYFEVYTSQSEAERASKVQAHLRIVAASDGHLVKDFPDFDLASYAQPGSPVISVAREVPIEVLPDGAYRLEVQATGSAGHSTPRQAANFAIIQ